MIFLGMKISILEREIATRIEIHRRVKNYDSLKIPHVFKVEPEDQQPSKEGPTLVI